MSKVVRLKPERSSKTVRKQRQDRFKLLVGAIEAIRDYAIFMLDPQGRILTWNAGAERIKGYKEREVVGKHFSIFYSPEDVARGHPQAELKETKKIGRYEEEGWRLRKDGTRFWANVVITKLVDAEGQVAGFSKVTRDLTERKMAEEELRSSEERFRLLVEGVKDYAIYMLDPTGKIVSWNEGAKRIKGYDYPEVVGKNFSMFYTDEDLNAGKPEYELKEASLTGRFEDEGWRVRKDGSMLWANVVLTAIRDRNRKLVGFTKVTRDLTEQKRADLRLQRAHADLEKRVEARTNELASSNELLKAREKQLEEAVRVRDEFLSIASHELKTPITSLRMQIQMIRARTRPEKSEMPDPRKLAHSLDTSLRQVDRLTGLVDDLLDVARAQAGKLTYRFEKLDLAALVSEVVERHAEQFEEASCPLELEAPKPVVGQFDRFRMEQVVENLITNAIKYARGTPVRVSIANRDGVAVLEISDGGPGISSELEARIFERFERGASARNLGGLGLGLYITRQIVEGHRGAVRVTNGAENGARFIVELPLNLIALRDPEGSGSP